MIMQTTNNSPALGALLVFLVLDHAAQTAFGADTMFPLDL